GTAQATHDVIERRHDEEIALASIAGIAFPDRVDDVDEIALHHHAGIIVPADPGGQSRIRGFPRAEPEPCRAGSARSCADDPGCNGARGSPCASAPSAR